MVIKKKPEDKAAATTPTGADADDSGLIDMGPDAPPLPAKSSVLKKKKLLIGGAAALLLVVGGGGAAMFMAGDHSETGADRADVEATAEARDATDVPEPVTGDDEGGKEGAEGELPLVDVPAMIVNMRTANGEARYLKIRFMLEATSASKVEALKAKLPAIIDSYQPFLRELRPEDISGSDAIFRIKEEMLVRATRVAGKKMVRDVLIQDLVQQ